MSGLEIYAALQGDLADDLAAENARLKDALRDCVMARAGFDRQPNGTWRREGGFGAVWSFIGGQLDADEAVALLAEHGIPMWVREVPS